jgi:uncharacterized protein YbbC (DUF1343 family)
MKYIVFILLFIFSCSSTQPVFKHIEEKKTSLINTEKQKYILSGLENFLQNYIHLVKNKRVGLVTNPSGVNRNLQSTVDLLFEHPEINLTVLFGPEHGIRGRQEAGKSINNNYDDKTNLPVFSLYGKTFKPTQEMLTNIDVLVFDIQDVGVRSYTYISTMAKVIEAAAEFNKEIIILDRPNPLGGNIVEGGIVRDGYFSLFSYFPIAYRYGMTIGEIANMYNMENHLNARLTVIPLLNWQREMFWPETGLPWVPTSPHVPHWQTTFFLPLTGIIGELHSISVGVGYTMPFELIGAPFIDATELAEELNNLHLPGLSFRSVHFIPFYSLMTNKIVHGVQIYLSDIRSMRPVVAGLHILKTIIDLYPEIDVFANNDRIDSFNKVLGSDDVYRGLKAGKSIEQLQAEWQAGLSSFLKIRQKYLLY